MFLRYWIMLGLFLLLMAGMLLLGEGDTSFVAVTPVAGEAGTGDPWDAIQQLRSQRAREVLGGYIRSAPDPGPGPQNPTFSMSGLPVPVGSAGFAAVMFGMEVVGPNWRRQIGSRSFWGSGSSMQPGGLLGRYLGLATDLGDRDQGLAEARRGMILAGSGRSRESVDAYRRAAELLPQLEDWLRIFSAEVAAQVGDTATVREMLDATDPVLVREWGWQSRVRSRDRAGDLRGAIAAAEAAGNGATSAERRADAWRIAGDFRLQVGELEASRFAFRRAIEAAPLSVAAVEAGRKLSGMANATPEDQLRVGRLFARHGNVDRAVAGFRAYLASGGATSAERAGIELEIVESYFRGGRNAEAERHALGLGNTASTAKVAAAALYLAGRAQYRQGRLNESRTTFLKLAARYPSEPATVQALFLVADLDHDAGRISSARRYYRQAASARVETPEAGVALMRLGGLSFSEGDYEAAAEIFEEYRRYHPRGRRAQQAAYWAARAHLEMGDATRGREHLRDARREDPFTWYGIRAAEQLGEKFWNVPMDAPPPQNRRIRDEVGGALVRLDLLRALGQESAANHEIDRLREHYLQRDGALYALAEALNARGQTFTGIRIGWEIHRREGVWNPRLLRIIYPFPYRTAIMAAARERGLDPFLVAGLIRQESMFNASIRSSVGAIGLMQIMPATGISLADRAGISAFTVSVLEDAEMNLRLGTAYLAELIGRYGAERPVSTLAAYNAGPQRVSRWSAFAEYADEELFAERIPFNETREYVKVVQQNARIYAALYGDHRDRVAADE